MNKRFSRIVCGFLSVVMCIFSTVNAANVRAEEVEIVPEYENAITVNALSVALKRGDGSFAEINEWTQVNNGDTLSLDFEWTALGTEQPPLTFVYDLSDALQNISLGNQVITTADATYRIVDQTLYIDIAKGKSGRSGTCRLEGTVDLSNASVDERGVTVLEFLDKSVYAYAPSKVTGVLVEKSAGEFVKDGDTYYQYFTIKVKNNSTENSVKGATLTDTFASDDNLFADSTLIGYTITKYDNTVYYGPSDITVGTVTALPEIAAGEYVTVTYKVKVDTEAALNQKSGENVATVGYSSAGDSKIAEGHASSNADIPVVSKTGYLDQNTKDKITYTITIDPGTLVADSTNFVVVDTPDGISAADIADAINENVADDSSKASAESDGTVSIPVGALNLSNGVYTLTYTVDLPDSFKNQIVNKNVKNTVSATFDGKYEYTSSADIYIPANGSALVNKSVESYDYETGVINWKVELFIPNDISETNTLNSYILSDWLNGWLDSALGAQGYSYFDEKGATDYAAIAEAVISGIKISAVGEDGNLLSDVPITDVKDYAIESYNPGDTQKAKFSTLKFTSDFLDNNAGQTVTLKYSSKMDTTVDGYQGLTYLNTAELSYSFTDGGGTIQSSAYVSPTVNVVKEANASDSSLPNAKRWVIRLNSIKYDFNENETITVTDILPEGYEIIPGSHGMNIANYAVSGKDDYTYPDKVSCATSTTADGRQQLDFSLTLTADMAEKISKTGDNYYLAIVFDAAMTDDYYNKFNLEKTTGVAVDITNNATVTVNGNGYDVSCTSQVTPVVPDGILSKSVVSEKILNSEGLETGKFEAEYTIVVNENAIDILENSDDLVLTDTLGTWLNLDEESIVIVPAVDSSDVSYNESTRTITFNLSDKTKYTITYKVTGDCAKFKTLESDTSGIDRADAEAMFSNTVTLTGQDISGISTSEMLDASTYETDATYKYDVLLSGEKLWSDETDTAVIPKAVTINLKETKTSPTGEVTVTPSSQTLEVTNADGSWSYKIENLVSKDAEGNRYTYEIVEVTVGGDTIENSGFTVTYADATSTETASGEEIVINFKNDFTADDDEVGVLKVTKDWDHGSNANAPSSVTVTLYEVNGNTETQVGAPKTITGESTVTFENIPLYNYSRDADDKLVRTLRQYKVVESTVGSYATTYSVDGGVAAEECEVFKLTDVEAAGTTVSAEDAKVVTITNTYEAPLPQQKFGAIKVTKTWEDNDDAENLRPQEITFVLKADGTEYDRQPVTGTTATFENLPVYKVVDGVVTDEEVVYTVEELAIAGYTTSYTDNTNIKLENGVTDNVTVKNTFNHTIKTGNVSVSKVWQDIFGNTDNGKNDSVNVTLYADGDEVETKATFASFTDLRLYKYSRADDGSIVETPINYTITEETVNGYTVSYELDSSALNGSFNLTADTTKNVTVTNKKNARSQEEGSIAVTKEWDDSSNTENIVHPVITVTLTSDDGAQDRSATITYPATTASFTNLPVYKVVDGVVTDTKVTYTLTESSVDGYDISYTDNTGIQLENGVTDNVTVKNTFNYTIEKGSVAVSKVWQTSAGVVDTTNDNSVSVTLYADGIAVGTKTVTRTSSASFDDLPVYKYSRDNDGKIVKTAIEYSLSETPIDGYITSYTIDASELNGDFDLVTSADRSIIVTNRKESADQKHGSVKVIKAWTDNNSPLRPEAITVVLSSDDNAGNRTLTVTPDAQGNWEATFTGLPVFKTGADGNVTEEKVTYTLTETSVDGYSVAYTSNENIKLTENGTAEVKVTNTLTNTPEKGSITVNKVWLDENGGQLAQDEKVEISVTLSDTVDGNSDQLKKITTAESSVTFDNLPVYESYERNANGIIVGVNPITYYVTETAVNGFETTYSVSPSSGLSLVTSSTGEVTITNKKKPLALGSIKVTKNWDDTANTAGIAHPAITVVLKADGVQKATDTIDANESTAIFENLPVYKADGITKIQYSVVEQTAVGYDTVAYSPEGSFALTENTESNVTITNTFDYNLKKGNISVTKKWVDSDGSDLAINDTITVEIKAGDTQVASDTITGSGTKTFRDLPLYEYTRNNNGGITSTEITYTVTETSAVSGYNVSYTLDGAALEGGFALVANDTREVVIENKKIAVTPPSSSESSSSSSSGGSGGGEETDDNGDSAETTPSQSSSDTTPSQSSSDTTPSQSSSGTTPSQSSSDTTPSQSSSGTTPSQSGSGTRPSYTTPSYIQTTTTVKNTTTTTAADITKDDGTTTAPEDEEPDETTVVDEDTDTTKPADPDDYEEDDSDEFDESEDEEDEMYDEDGGIDDYIGEDTDFDTDIEENPHTSITINFGYVLSFAFGTYAFFPRKKRKN